MEPAKVIIPMVGNYYATFRCSDIVAMYGGATPPVYGQYPAYANMNATTKGFVAVWAGKPTLPEGASATLQLSFGLEVRSLSKHLIYIYSPSISMLITDIDVALPHYPFRRCGNVSPYDSS